MEGIEDDSNFLRKSVNDITSLLDINFGSLGRPSRGGRGRESHSGPTSRPERAKPILEKVSSPLSLPSSLVDVFDLNTFSSNDTNS